MQKFPQRVFGIFEEQAVVAKRRHGNGDLSKVVEILQHRTLQKNHQTQVTVPETGETEGGRGEPLSEETRGLGGVYASPHSSPSSPNSVPTLTATSFPPPMPISPWDSPPARCRKCSLLAPKRRHSSRQEGRLTPGGQARRCPTFVVFCSDHKHSG